MSFDFKKEYKEFYMPKSVPSIVTVPKMNYIAVRGKGDPNDVNGEYKNSIGLLYGIAFTVKMSYKGDHKIDGYFDYVVPPLEGFWWQDGARYIDYAHKEDFNFISVIRLPDFVSKVDFDWAVREATKKKKQDFSRVEFLTYAEGVCVQCMHVGSYDDEPKTVALMHEHMKANGYESDITDKRLHHEIYLSDPRKCDINKLKTVVRHPIKKSERKQNNNMRELTAMKNIGTEMARKLRSVNINSAEDLTALGSKEAFSRLKTRYPDICLVFLYVLQGAIDNTDYNLLSKEIKADLKKFNDQFKK